MSAKIKYNKKTNEEQTSEGEREGTKIKWITKESNEIRQNEKKSIKYKCMRQQWIPTQTQTHAHTQIHSIHL